MRYTLWWRTKQDDIVCVGETARTDTAVYVEAQLSRLGYEVSITLQIPPEVRP